VNDDLAVITVEQLTKANPGWVIEPGTMWSAERRSEDGRSRRTVMAPTARELARLLREIAAES
jgi:hypothetical protein